MSETAVAKKQSKPPTPEPTPPPPRRLSIQANEAWLRWVSEGAEYCRTDVSKAVDAALAAYFKANGFETRPPRRVP